MTACTAACTICCANYVYSLTSNNFLVDLIYMAANESCPICLEDFICPISTNCGHKFCARCMLSHLQHDCRCPMCRREVAINDHTLVYLYLYRICIVCFLAENLQYKVVLWRPFRFTGSSVNGRGRMEFCGEQKHLQSSGGVQS